MSETPEDREHADLPPVRVLISYRRDDTAGHAGRLYDSLSERFGREQIFIDIAAIEPGVDFSETIAREVGSCDVLLAVIGRQWLTVTDAKGRRRLDNPDDYHRLEIQAALERNIRVIPCLVQNAQMPALDDLPEAIQRLALRNALELSDERWSYDVGRLDAAISSVARAKALRPKEEDEAPKEPEPEEPEAPPTIEELQANAVPEEIPPVEEPAGEAEPLPTPAVPMEPDAFVHVEPPDLPGTPPPPPTPMPEPTPEPEPEPTEPAPEPEPEPEPAPAAFVPPPPVEPAAMVTAPITPAPPTESFPPVAPPPPPPGPSEPKRSRRGLLIGIVIAAVILGGGATAFVLTRDDTPERTIPTVDPTSPTPTITVTTTTTPAPADPHAELIARVPASFSATCADDDANYLPDLALGGIRCTASGIEVWYYLFSTGADVDDWYSRRIADTGITQGMGGDCASDDTAEDQLQVGGVDVEGRLFCLTNDRGRWIEWKRTDYRIYAYVLRADGNRSSLYEFWTGAGPNAL